MGVQSFNKRIPKRKSDQLPDQNNGVVGYVVYNPENYEQKHNNQTQKTDVLRLIENFNLNEVAQKRKQQSQKEEEIIKRFDEQNSHQYPSQKKINHDKFANPDNGQKQPIRNDPFRTQTVHAKAKPTRLETKNTDNLHSRIGDEPPPGESDEMAHKTKPIRTGVKSVVSEDNELLFDLLGMEDIPPEFINELPPNLKEKYLRMKNR